MSLYISAQGHRIGSRWRLQSPSIVTPLPIFMQVVVLPT
jgi:hypothetical protein